jgi:hypothetical protein
LEHANLDLRSELGRRAGELVRRVVQQRRLAAQAVEREREQRAPVDRDRESRAQQLQRAGGSLRIEVSGAERRPPAPDRDQRGVEAVGERLHLVEDVCVAGEVDAAPGLAEQVADGLGRRTERVAAGVVVGGRGGDRQAADLGLLAGRQLDDTLEAELGDVAAQAARDDQRRLRPLGGEPAQRRGVEVVEVGVRDEDGVEVAERVGVDGAAVAAQVRDPPAEDRVCEDADAAELDQQRRVPDVCDAVVQSPGQAPVSFWKPLAPPRLTTALTTA